MAHRGAGPNRERVELIGRHLIPDLLMVDLGRVRVDVHLRMVGPTRIRGCEPLGVLHAIGCGVEQDPPDEQGFFDVVEVLDDLAAVVAGYALMMGKFDGCFAHLVHLIFLLCPQTGG
jgi:hypothetical protein